MWAAHGDEMEGQEGCHCPHVVHLSFRQAGECQSWQKNVLNKESPFKSRTVSLAVFLQVAQIHNNCQHIVRDQGQDDSISFMTTDSVCDIPDTGLDCPQYTKKFSV